MPPASLDDLERWLPRLIGVWRKAHRRPGPSDRLTPPEVREVAAGIKQLSLGLTRDRALAGARYMDDPTLLGAYLLFYWPVSYAQGRQVFGELSPRPRRVLDLGSGPGPLAFAALDAGAAEATCADRSRPALALARELAAAADEALATREWDPLRQTALPDGPFDLICAGHLVNELYSTGPEAIERRVGLIEPWLQALKPRGALVLIEPALRHTSRELLQVRDALTAKGYAVRAPCLFRGACPALVKETDWCHAERAWEPPRLVAELARAASIHKEALKMSYLVLAPRGEAWREPPPGRLFRVVSETLQGKGRQRVIGCGPEGRVGLAMQEKHRTPDNAAFFYLKRGDVLRATGLEEKGDGLAMTDRSEVRVIAPAGKGLPEPWET